ncbi:hypothetical protein, partial [Klebsiella pneumoniae]|uniref:hypothetical protein n=1 Tax=Klebsiella pneumoniae TaxID=573 RepID=UPI001C6035B8
RLGYLSIEVAEGFEGSYAKAFLSAYFPALQHCTIQFRGCRNVLLNPNGDALFGGGAPLLRTLDLTNCYISPTSNKCSSVSSLAIRCFFPLDLAPTSLSLDTFYLLGVQFNC